MSISQATGEPRSVLKRLIRLVRSPALVYLTASALSRLGALVLVPLYTRRLSLEEYGDYALALSVQTLLPFVITLGLNSAIPRAFFGRQLRSRGLLEAGRVAAWVGVFATTSGAILAAAALLLGPVGSGGLVHRWEMICLIVAGVGSALTSVPSVVLRAAQRPFAAATFQLLEFFSVASGGLLLVGFMHRGLRGAIEGLACAYTLNGIVSAVFIKIALRPKLRKRALRSSFVVGISLVPHFLANWAQQVSDRWVLKFAGLGAGLGSYAAAAQVATPTAMAVAAWHDAASARLGEAFRGGGLGGMRAIFRKMSIGYAGAALLPGVVTIAVLPLAALVLGKTFSGAIWVVPILLGISVIDSQYYTGMNVTYFADRTKTIPMITIASAVVNVTANLVLIPYSGLMGALIARALSVSVRSMLVLLVARQCLRGTKPAARAPVGPERGGSAVA